MNRMKSVWIDFGYPEEALIRHLAEALFLKNSRLMFIIKGYSETPILFDPADYHPKILCNGSYQRVGNLIEENGFSLYHNGLTVEITDKLGLEWNFVKDHGFIQTDWRFKKAFPTFKLSSVQMAQLKELGQKQNPNPSKTAFIQVYTSKRPLFKDNWLTKNFNNQTPSHVGMRLIKEDGTGYSTGYESHRLRQDNFSFLPFTFLKTTAGKPTLRDYDEFYPYTTRLVTTIPVDPQTMETLLDEIEELSHSSDCRFNLANMNCLTFTNLTLKRAGIDASFEEYINSILLNGLPSLKLMTKSLKPWINYLPAWAQKALNTLPNKTNTLIINLILMAIGMNRRSKEVTEQNTHPAPLNWKTLSKDVTQLKLFNKEQTRIYWTPLITAWQKEQPSTQFFHYKKGDPVFNIVA